MSELTEKRFRELKDEVQEARTAADKAKGAVETLVKNLQDEFKCKNPKEAKELLEELKKEADKAEKEFDKALKAYEEKWHAQD